MLLHFGQLSPLGVVANLLVVPLAGLLTTGGVLTLAVATLREPLADPLFQSLWLLLVTLRVVVRAFAALPGAAVHVPPPPALWPMAASALALVLGPYGARADWRLGGSPSLALGATVGHDRARSGRTGWRRSIVLDVGQGEAILVRAPDGQALLVDTGGGGPGRGDRGERVVVPILRRLGLRRLTALALTHGAPDRRGRPGRAARGHPGRRGRGSRQGSEGAAWLTPAGGARDPAVASLARGDRRWLGSVLVTALHPPARRRSDRNRPQGSRSVLRIEWGSVRGDPGRRRRAGGGDRHRPGAGSRSARRS